MLSGEGMLSGEDTRGGEGMLSGEDTRGELYDKIVAFICFILFATHPMQFPCSFFWETLPHRLHLGGTLALSTYFLYLLPYIIMFGSIARIGGIICVSIVNNLMTNINKKYFNFYIIYIIIINFNFYLLNKLVDTFNLGII